MGPKSLAIILANNCIRPNLCQVQLFLIYSNWFLEHKYVADTFLQRNSILCKRGEHTFMMKLIFLCNCFILD